MRPLCSQYMHSIYSLARCPRMAVIEILCQEQLTKKIAQKEPEIGRKLCTINCMVWNSGEHSGQSVFVLYHREPVTFTAKLPLQLPVLGRLFSLKMLVKTLITYVGNLSLALQY